MRSRSRSTSGCRDRCAASCAARCWTAARPWVVRRDKRRKTPGPERGPTSQRRAVGLDVALPRAVGAGVPGRRPSPVSAIRVLVLTWDFPPARGGIQIWMYQLARRLPNADVTVLAPSALGSRAFDQGSGVQVRRVGGAGFGPVLWLWRLSLAVLRACVSRKPDVVVCGHVVVAPAALLARALFGVPCVVFAYAYEIRRRRRRAVVGRLLRSADAVLAISAFTRSRVLEHRVAPERIHMLHPGVDPDRFTPNTNRIDGTQPTLLSVARLTELYKGHDTAIRALPLIKAKCGDVRYVLAGDGPLRDYLTRVARSVGVEQNVVFLGDVADESLGDLYRSSDVVVLLSRESTSEGGA